MCDEKKSWKEGEITHINYVGRRGMYNFCGYINFEQNWHMYLTITRKWLLRKEISTPLHCVVIYITGYLLTIKISVQSERILGNNFENQSFTKHILWMILSDMPDQRHV